MTSVDNLLAVLGLLTGTGSAGSLGPVLSILAYGSSGH